MSEKHYEELLKPFNRCGHTGVEDCILSEDMGEFSIEVFKDHVGRLRGVVSVDSDYVCGILFDESGECALRYTREDHRGKHLSKQLFAYMQWKFPKNKLRHSEYLTEAGRKSL